MDEHRPDVRFDERLRQVMGERAYRRCGVVADAGQATERLLVDGERTVEFLADALRDACSASARRL